MNTQAVHCEICLCFNSFAQLLSQRIFERHTKHEIINLVMTEYALNQRRAVTPDKNCRGMVQNFQDLSLDSSFFLGECN